MYLNPRTAENQGAQPSRYRPWREAPSSLAWHRGTSWQRTARVALAPLRRCVDGPAERRRRGRACPPWPDGAIAVGIGATTSAYSPLTCTDALAWLPG